MGEKIFDEAFFSKLNNITLNARMIMNTGNSGARKSRSKGSSVEFSDYREYTAGDDFRRVDWNAYGRFNKLFVKLFMEEREAVVNVFIDSSKSMDFGEHRKSICALKIAAVLSYLSLNNLDRVCINSIKEENTYSYPMLSGKGAFQNSISYLQNIEFALNTNINSSIKKKELKLPGIAVIISDFFTEGGIEQAIKYLVYKKQQVILIHVMSEEELNPAMEGNLKLVDSETKLEENIIITPTLLKKYNEHLKQFTTSLKELCSKYAATYVKVNSSTDIERIVFDELVAAGIIK